MKGGQALFYVILFNYFKTHSIITLCTLLCLQVSEAISNKVHVFTELTGSASTIYN